LPYADRVPVAAMLIAPGPDDLCLSFVNTLSWRGTGAPVEALRDFAGALAWLRTHAGLSAAGTRHASAWARAHAGLASRVHADVIALREVLYALFSARAAGKQMPRAEFGAFQHALAAAPVRRLLVASRAGCAWQVEPAEQTAPYLLAPVLWSAADLLAGERRHRARQCANERCLWLFVDRSKKATRRWCDMASCGNRAKAQRHYLRTKRSQS
jgi:predicted RNA-binding Zn ribbon-like protein